MNHTLSNEIGQDCGCRRLVAAIVCLPMLSVLVAGCATKGMSFPTADAAVESVVSALRADDTAKLDRILGPKADEALSSGDPVADAQAVEQFLAEYDVRHELVPGSEGQSMILEVGDADWPMPIPIVKDSKGWRFDTAAGLEEMLDRRIGRNEIDTIETCRAINDAQVEYLLMNPAEGTTPAFAGKLISSPGAFDGLYWPDDESGRLSPLGPLVAEALERGYTVTGTGAPYRGYRYRLLTAQGQFAPGGAMSYLAGGRLTRGYAIVAYPARYGNSGIMTFIMNQQGIVYQRDLGANTASIGAAMTEFDPDPEWTLVE